MQRLKGFIIALCLTLFSFAPAEACKGKFAERITFGGFERVTHLSTSGMNLWIKVANANGRKLVVPEAEVDIYVDGVKRLTLSLREKVSVPRKATSDVLVPIRITSHSMFSMVSILGHIIMGESEDVTINYRMRAGTPLFKRTFEAENVPVKVLLAKMGLPTSELEILRSLLD